MRVPPKAKAMASNRLSVKPKPMACRSTRFEGSPCEVSATQWESSLTWKRVPIRAVPVEAET